MGQLIGTLFRQTIAELTHDGAIDLRHVSLGLSHTSLYAPLQAVRDVALAA
jgi:hypothetical protein